MVCDGAQGFRYLGSDGSGGLGRVVLPALDDQQFGFGLRKVLAGQPDQGFKILFDG